MERQNVETSSKGTSSNLIESYIVQCVKCNKWRYIESGEEYEDIRSKGVEDPYECDNCDEATDADVENDSSRLWFEDHHGIPKAPKAFKRIVNLRRSGDQADVYYITPKGKKLRSSNEVGNFIKKNKEFQGIDMQDFSFVRPKLMKKPKSKNVV